MIKSTFILVVIALSFQISQAQTDSIRTEDIEVVKDYTPFLEQGNKQSFRPGSQNVEAQPPKTYNYAIPSQFIQTQFPPSEIKPLALNYRRNIQGKNAYLKGGFGTFDAPLVQLALGKAEIDNYSVGLLGDYYSGKGDLFDDQRLANLKLTGFASKELNGASLDGSVHYKNNTDWQYGYDHAVILNEDLVKQQFSDIGGSINLSNSNDDNVGLNYLIGLDVSAINDELYDLNETNADIRAGVEKRFNNDSKVKLNVLANLRNTDGLTNTTESEQVLTAIPVFVPQIGDWQLELGASINYDEFHEFQIFPNVSLEKLLNDERFTVFAGWKGRTQPFGLKHAAAINPYLNSNIALSNYTEDKRTPLGIKGRLSPSLAFNASISQIVTENQAFFVNDFSDLAAASDRTFITQFDQELVNWNLNGELNYLFSDNANVLLKARVNNYSTDTIAHAYHLPDIEFFADFNVSPIDKLEINGGLTTLTGIQALNADGTDDKLDAIFNLNLGAKYNFTDNIGVFIDANNLGGQEFQRWKNYDTFGLNILGGFVLSY